MAKIKIDGTEYEVPKMKFKTLKKAYRVVETVRSSEDPLEMSDAIIDVLSMAMMREFPHMTPEWIQDNIEADEMTAIGPVFIEALQDSGLLQNGHLAQGEAPGAAPSTEISTPSSLNSSQQDAVEATGT